MVRVHTHTHPNNGPMSRTTQVSRYQKGKTNLDFTGARDSEWQWHQLGMCKSAPSCRQITTPAPHHSDSLTKLEQRVRLKSLNDCLGYLRFLTARRYATHGCVCLSVTDALPVTQPTVSKH